MKPSIKIGTKKEVLWTDIKNRTVEDMQKLENQKSINLEKIQREMDICQAIKEIAEKTIAEESKK